MKGILISKFGAPDVCKVTELEKPKPGPKQILIRVKDAGLNPLDTYIRSGTFPIKPSLPYTPGTDCAGVVESVGDGVTEFSPGDSVFTLNSITGTGTCAQYTVTNATQCFPLKTDKLDYKQGACLGIPYFTAYRSIIHHAKAKAGESILVHGASGGVGTLCVQMAKFLGLKVFATAGSKEGLELVKSCGADFVYNHHDKDHVQKIKDDLGGKGVDIVIEMLANMNLQSDIDMVTEGGRIIVVGSRGTVEITPMTMIMKDCSVIGCLVFAATPEDWREMRAAWSDHQKLDWLRPVVSKVYSLEQVAQAHKDIIQTKSALGNLVIKTD